MPTPIQPATPAVNTGHALAASLAFAAVFSQGSGSASELVTARTGALGVDASWTTGLYGNAVSSADLSHNASVNFGTYRPLTGGATWSGFFLVKCGTHGNYRAIMAARDAYSTMDFDVEVHQDGTVMVGNSGQLVSATGAVLTPGAWTTVGVAVNGTDGKVYLGGTLAGTAAGDFRASASGPNAVRVGGIGPSDSPESFGGSVELAYLWTGRVLTQADFAAMTTNPYVFMGSTTSAPRSRVTFGGGFGGFSGGFVG